MTEKDIRNLKSSTASTIHSEKDISFLEDEKVRKDAFGNLISKGKNKKQKISFSDNLALNDKLVNIIPVESYKKYNYFIIIDGVIYNIKEEEIKEIKEIKEIEDEISIDKYDGSLGKSCSIF